jgi:predicted nucleic acid-binding protein
LCTMHEELVEYSDCHGHQCPHIRISLEWQATTVNSDCKRLALLVRILSGKFNLAADEVIKVVTDIKHTGRNVHVTSDESPIVEDATDNLFINLAIDGSPSSAVKKFSCSNYILLCFK